MAKDGGRDNAQYALRGQIQQSLVRIPQRRRQGDAQTKQFTARKTDLDAQVSAYGTFRAALEALQATLPALKGANKFQGRSAAVGDIAIATASADSTATPAQFTINGFAATSSSNAVSAVIVKRRFGAADPS